MGYNKASNTSDSQTHFGFDIFFPKQKQDSDNWATITLSALLKSPGFLVCGSGAAPLQHEFVTEPKVHDSPAVLAVLRHTALLRLPLAWGETIFIPGKKSPTVPIPERFQRALSFLDSASGVLGTLSSVQNPWHYICLCSMLPWKNEKIDSCRYIFVYHL